MTKIQKIVFFGLLLGIAGLVYLEATKPLPVNWFPSYTNSDKIPLGTYVLWNLLEDTFENQIEEISIPPFEKLQDSSFAGTYFFVNNSINFDDAELEALLDWAAKGNTVFVSANSIGYGILDTLQLEIDSDILYDRITVEPMVNLLNEKLKANVPYHIPRNLGLNYFSEIDTLQHTVLGVSQIYNDTLKITEPLINFIKAPVGEGAFYLHMRPEVFSNYFILHRDFASHTENVLSYINTGAPIYWDKHYKAGKAINISPLYILFNNRYLKWAYYIVLIGVLLFVLFEGKRKQRSIPIVESLSNKTYDYTRTIAGMYLEKKEHQEIAKKQIALFFEFIRTRLRVPTEKINTRFFTAVASRSGNSLEDTKNLFIFIEKVQHQTVTSTEELVKLNQEITEFKKKIDGKP